MQVKLESLTARSIAGMLYAGKLNAAQTYQILEEGGYDDKITRIEELLMDMEAVQEYYTHNQR